MMAANSLITVSGERKSWQAFSTKRWLASRSRLSRVFSAVRPSISRRACDNALLVEERMADGSLERCRRQAFLRKVVRGTCIDAAQVGLGIGILRQHDDRRWAVRIDARADECDGVFRSRGVGAKVDIVLVLLHELYALAPIAHPVADGAAAERVVEQRPCSLPRTGRRGRRAGPGARSTEPALMPRRRRTICRGRRGDGSGAVAGAGETSVRKVANSPRGIR